MTDTPGEHSIGRPVAVAPAVEMMRANDEAIEISDGMLDPIFPGKQSDPRDFERGMSYVPTISIGLIVANLVAFAWSLTQMRDYSPEEFVAIGALHRASILSGQAWRLATAPFLHAGAEHLAGNMIMLYVLGMACEHAFGHWRMLAMYAVGAIGGSLLSAACSEGPSVGASGAVFGLAGMMVTFFIRRRADFHLRDKRIGGVLLIWAGYTVVIGFLSPQIDNFCHIGGFIAGAILGFLVPPRSRRETRVVPSVT